MNESIKELLNKRLEEDNVETIEELLVSVRNFVEEKKGTAKAVELGFLLSQDLLVNKSKQFNINMAEIVEKLSRITKTQKELEMVSSGITKIAMEQLVETEQMPTLIDDISARKTEVAVNTLRRGLESGNGIIISDTLKLPSRLPDGTLSVNSHVEGHIIFGNPDAKTKDFVVRTVQPSFSDPLSAVEKEEFRVPFELILLAFSNNEINSRITSIKGESTKGKLFNFEKDFDAVEFATVSNRKRNKIKELINIRKEQGFELLGLSILEQDEPFQHPVTKQPTAHFATNIIGIFRRKGTKQGFASTNDELVVEGWKISQYEKELEKALGAGYDFVVKTNIAELGWSLPLMEMEHSISLLSEFADENWESYEDNVSSK